MKTVTIMDGREFRLESSGNGWGYTLTEKPTGKSLWVQDDTAANFRCDLGDIERAQPGYSADRVLGYLWSECEYGSLATFPTIRPWGECSAWPAKWQVEFPDFPAADMPVIPAGFTDRSWRNDMCPGFERGELTLWIDYLDPGLREFPDSFRFVLVKGEDMLGCSNDWSVMADEIARRVGEG